MIDGTVALEGAEEPLPESQCPQGFVGLEEYLLDIPCRQTVLARTSVMMVAIDPASREAFIRNYPELTLALLREKTKN